MATQAVGVILLLRLTTLPRCHHGYIRRTILKSRLIPTPPLPLPTLLPPRHLLVLQMREEEVVKTPAVPMDPQVRLLKVMPTTKMMQINKKKLSLESFSLARCLLDTSLSTMQTRMLKNIFTNRLIHNIICHVSFHQLAKK